MGLNRKSIIALSLLGILLVFVWTRALGPKPGSPARPSAEAFAPVSAPPQTEKPAAVPAGQPGWKGSPFLVDRGGLKPGTQTDGTGEAEIFLQGILWDPGAPTAILNNRVMGVGDRIGRWEVKEIQKDQVVVSDGASTRSLRP